MFIQKNFEGVVEKIKGRLDKWTFLLHKTSYKGRVLIVNNLVASSLWHRLACVDPPTHLLSKIQSILVDFFWDKLHWVPQSVLFLPKEEGGHGLVQLQSRTAAFRVQFLQRLLTGTVDSNWKYAACAILQTFDGLVSFYSAANEERNVLALAFKGAVDPWFSPGYSCGKASSQFGIYSRQGWSYNPGGFTAVGWTRSG